MKRRYVLTGKEIDHIVVYDLRDAEDTEGEALDVIEGQPYYVLPQEQHKSFVTSLSDIKFNITVILFPAAVDPSFWYGDWTVGVYYTDGSIRFISDFGWGEYFDADGSSKTWNHAGCDTEDWENLIQKYVPAEILN